MTSPRLSLALPAEAARRHPLWCQNSDGATDCACADEDYLVIHSRGARVVTAASPVRQPTGIGVDLCRVLRRSEPECMTIAEVVVPGGHADLTRDQLRHLIAELQHIDHLWEI